MINSAILIMLLYSTFVSPTDIEDTTEYQEKIYWGHTVHKLGAYPYLYSIQEPYNGHPSGYRHFCGGALVERRIIITAAHCLLNKSLNTQFRLLPNYRNSPYIRNNDLTFKVSDVAFHPDRNKRPSSMHDIGVILMNKHDPRINVKVQLPFRHLPVNTKLKIMGYGLSEYGDYPDRLQEATVDILTDKKCLDEKTGFEYAPIHNICTHNKDGAGGCYRDAGSPLVWENPQDNRSYLYGVLSSEQSPCNRFHTDVFVNVFAHLKFIKDAYLQLARDELSCNPHPRERSQLLSY